ncbi:hypothetical protein EMIHUDRAFT_464772 [Emiliania huxleyi CCMP1516]|uniref:Uncharacterized protein n=2 Tax=Emiliania huxleyi TaxID=2903 RepID=A0A0D3INP2_EMIH1|nr:hypothetical protein EMIHUDRAFT_464772 [Emiliania huxleyi CCMP1516]EOD12877.1 hypothetical protein EMIHUDRAFT_464772 [Emiliania huxleyi CCMP1516]|eukprot:XP_005765306.1 hypothetical protein EMIHUDRAFT_464772 [Emiliania huxleyi CCMP1516]
MASIEQAVAALNAAAAGVLGFEPALSFAGARDAEHLVASFGALVTACKSAQAAASAAELSAARQYAAADRLDKAVHASRARIDSLEAQVSRQEAELDRRSKALSGAMHREAQREATLRRREREIERMQARLADKLRGGAKAQLIEAPAARKREAAAAADGQRQMALDSRLPSPLRPLRDISPNRRSGAATPPSAKAAAREALSEERRLLREQRERLLERAAAVDEAAEAVDQRRRDRGSVVGRAFVAAHGLAPRPLSNPCAALASFLDSLNERLFTPTTTGPCATAADGGLSPPTPSSRSRRLFASRAAGAPKPADPPNDPPAAGSDEAAGPSEAPAAGPSPIPPLVSIERC